MGLRELCRNDGVDSFVHMLTITNLFLPTPISFCADLIRQREISDSCLKYQYPYAIYPISLSTSCFSSCAHAFYELSTGFARVSIAFVCT